MAALEVEIKSLLGSADRADELRTKLIEADPDAKLVGKSSQLNHYFIDGDVCMLRESLKSYLSGKDVKQLQEVIDAGNDFSVRTRLIDNETLLFVIKASRDDGSSHNTVSRLEFEAEISGMTLHELDELVLAAGFEYQAKWSREREEYVSKDITVCLDKNAGYGYLAEFEKVLDSESQMKEAERELRSFMDKLGVEELPQDRLERMFAHYNANWPEYYGTDNVFTIE